jgi:hypothetical protein
MGDRSPSTKPDHEKIVAAVLVAIAGAGAVLLAVVAKKQF